MKIMKFCVLSALLSMAAPGGMPDAHSASAPPPPRTPASPTSAANPPSLESPAGGTAPDVPAVRPRAPNLTPMPAPAATDNYAGLAGHTSRQPWTN